MLRLEKRASVSPYSKSTGFGAPLISQPGRTPAASFPRRGKPNRKDLIMDYLSIKGDFGGFSGEVELAPGLNAVVAENESGKSTFCGLIRAMLYGVNTAERGSAEKLPDKIKYQPWSGKPMNGRMVISREGRKIVLTRSSERGPMRDFSAVYADTAEPVPGLTGTNAGEILCGMASEVFEKTAFCSAEGLSIKNSAALEASIAAAIGSGGDEASPTQADARLAAWQRERKFGNRGEIPELEEKICRLNEKLGAIADKNAEILELSAEIKSLRSKKLILDTEIAASEDRQKNRLLHRESRQKCDEQRAEIEAFIAENRLSGPRADPAEAEAAEKALRLASGLENDVKIANTEYYRMQVEFSKTETPAELAVFEGCSPEYAVAEAEKAKKRWKRLMATGPKYWLFIISALLLAAGIVILSLVDPELPAVRFPAYVCFAGAALTAVLGISGTVTAVKNKREAREMLSRWGCRTPEQFREIARGYELFYRGRKAAEAELAAAENAITALEDKLAFAARSAEGYVTRLGLDRADPRRDAAVLMANLEHLKQMYKKLGSIEGAVATYSEPEVESDEMLRPAMEKLNGTLRERELKLERLIGLRAAIGDGDGLRADLEAAQESLQAKTEELNAIIAARELLSRVSEEFSREMTPRIAARAEEIFTHLTQGRYGQLQLSRNLEAAAVPEGEAVARKLLYLSRGAADQAWLAIRLALSEALTDSAPVPLVLDDVLAMYDDSRAETAIKFFADLAKTRQIILFTCRSREAEVVSAVGGKVVRI